MWLFPGADLTNNQGKGSLRAPSDIYLVNAPVCNCILESVTYSLIVLSSAMNPTMCRYDVNKGFSVQCRELR